ncbi:hypothetical protein J9D75_000948 [Salmonella enterica]|nr:hypothetical protein [Salmonella enterica]HAK3123637.1 hypothetical protein [Salmonella enterica]
MKPLSGMTGYDVFPAPAGINRAINEQAGCPRSVPRASGDKPLWATLLAIVKMCSPRQRG